MGRGGRGRGSSRGRGFEFCCCAIPLINVGAHVVVLEVALVSFITGILALAPHPITAGQGVIPSYAKAIIAALAFVTCLWQIVGLVAIRREATRLYHGYVRVSTLLTILTILVAVAFTVLAAIKHSTAQTTCVANYGAVPSTTSSGFTNSSISQNFGSQICNYFLWAQVGAMFGLIVLFGVVQLYMCFASRAYGVAQRGAERDAKMGLNATDHRGGALDEDIPLSSRNVGGAMASSPTWEEAAPLHSNSNGAAAEKYHHHSSSTGGGAETMPGGYPAYAGGEAPNAAAQHGAYPAYQAYPAYESRSGGGGGY